MASADEEGVAMSVLKIFPLLLLPAILYALIALPAGRDVASAFASPAFEMPLASGQVWRMTWGHVILTLATITLFFEVLKSSSPSKEQLIDNGLSVVVFIGFFVLFLLVPAFGSGEFFVLMMMALLDFLAGSVIATRVSQRTVQYGS
jgi:hypothetical protein